MKNPAQNLKSLASLLGVGSTVLHLYGIWLFDTCMIKILLANDKR